MTQSDIQQLVTLLGFLPDVSGNTYTKMYPQHQNYKLELDLVNRRIQYADPIKVHDETTSHFSAPENFVVLECVNRLLEKGYEPQHIELERRWSLGRTGKSGKADITVFDRDGQSLIVIECKTAGGEYEKEKRNTTASGGQLFSYLQQDRNTRFLCLYASEVRKESVRYDNAIIQIKDRPEVTELVRKDPDTVAYETAKTKEELHRAWKENFNTYFAPNGIFDEEAQAYNPEFKPIKRKDLKPFTEKEGRQFFNAFEEILRHNNISDRSNAFNRILSLILCKIVDERKQPNEETGFQVKEATDTPEAIQERLQRLYQQGMQDYLKEEFTYIAEEEVEEIVKRFPRQTAQQQIKDIIRRLKFYSNNEFAFKEVHNESLFNENAKVLNEIIALLQYKQFRYQRADALEYKHQKRYLGDFFELLLDAGYKQTAGQFFTPLPIARFIVKSLPLGQIIRQKLDGQRTNFLLYVMDYACGSGHFLTEVMEEVQTHIDQLDAAFSDDINLNLDHWQKADWTGEFIYGIEKDYRLARTAKVACFMNGDGEANIIFGDGLEDYTRPVKGRNYKFPQAGFDVIVANPPYSIQSFKTHLGLKNSQFTLFDSLTESASEIEVLFIERTAQLLREGGVAGVVLPSSILSNKGIYTRARELMLQRFEVKTVVEFPPNTFMATPTNTVGLFLARRNDRLADDFRAVADDFILHNRTRPDDFTDTEALLEAYVSRLNLTLPDYRSLLARTPTDTLKQTDFWREYERWFYELTEIKNLRQKDREFNKLTPDQQQTELTRRFYERVLPSEHDKFLYFCLTYGQNTLIVRLPTDGAERKKFLGYEFSDRRGDEGIKLNTDGQGRHQTTLYDEENLYHPDKLNTLVWQTLSGQIPTIPDILEAHAKIVDLADCLDFERVEFEKKISLNANVKQVLQSKWSLVKLGNVEYVEIDPPKKEIADLPDDTIISFIEMSSVSNDGKITEMVERPLKEVKKGGFTYFRNHDVLLAKITPCMENGKGGVPTSLTNSIGFGSTEFFVLRPKPSLLSQYLFQFTQSSAFRKEAALNMTGSTGHKRVSKEFLEGYLIPLPPLSVQQQIVTEIDAIDAQELADKQVIEQSRKEIEERVNTFFDSASQRKRVGELFFINEETSNPAKTYGNDVFIYVDIECVEKKTGRVHYDQHITGIAAPSRARRIAKDRSVLVSTVRPNLKGFAYLDTVPLNCIFSTGFAILRSKNEQEFHAKLLFYYFMWSKALMQQMFEKMPKAAYPSINDGDISDFRIAIWPEEQEKLLQTLQTLETRIREAEDRLADVAAQKADVLKRYL